MGEQGEHDHIQLTPPVATFMALLFATYKLQKDWPLELLGLFYLAVKRFPNLPGGEDWWPSWQAEDNSGKAFLPISFL